MSDSLDPRNDLTERLAALGRQPVAPAVRSQHLTALASVPVARSFRTSLAGRLKVGAGVLAGFLLGASGLTAAGAMGPLQPVAAKVAAEVAKVEVPQGPKDQAEKKAKKAKAEKAAKSRLADGSIGTARDWSDNCADNGTPGEYAGNRGQYLKQERAKGADQLAAAKASTCGLPIGAEKDASDEDESKGEPKAEKAPAQDDGAGKSDDEHGKATAPGHQDKGAHGDKAAGGEANGPKADDGDDEGDEPATSAGPPEAAGESGIAPPVEDTPAQPAPAEDKPAEDTPAGDEV
ncbi:MAG TPA: hypothetical protein VM933_04610 [Acidimicrobiales bacterium]|nr:hypothetical protein [Acidimicrobiales bacterium]